MAELALVHNGQATLGEDIARPIRLKLRQARDQRKKKLEPTWHMSLAFAAGKHWLVYDRNTRQLRNVQDVDPRYRDRELYQADIITEYRTTALGELGSDNDRPELLLQRDDQASEDYQAQVNRALGYAWDFEFDGDQALAEADRLCVDLGTSAIRCRFDPQAGPVKDEWPHQNGQPIFDLEHARSLLQDGPRPDVTIEPIHEGRITWEPLSAFNLIVPPGVSHEKYFPWECVVRPALLTDVQAEYPAAADLREDTDIGSMLGTETSGPSLIDGMTETRADRLRDHVWLFTYYERPSRKNPQGRVLVFAGNEMKLIHVDDKLPYVAPDGSYRSGIAYFHWWRVTGRFWSRSLIEAMIDGQRGINRLGTQIGEITNRGMPFWFVQKDSRAISKTGVPMEFVELEQSERQPVAHPGVAPGPWMQARVEQIREDIEHATGIRGPRLGENPTGVTTYSQLALLNENDQVKRGPILGDRKLAISKLVEDSVYDMRTYWGSDKQVMLAGDEEQAEAQTFNATKIPPFFIVKVAKGAAKPRSQAAELKKVEDIWAAILASGAVLADPGRFVQWLKESLDAGEALELPENPTDDQADKAQLENHLMLARQQALPVAYYDPPAIHIPLHRQAQIQAELTGDPATWELIEQHVQQHLLAAQKNAAALPPPPEPAAGQLPAGQSQARPEPQSASMGTPPIPGGP